MNGLGRHDSELVLNFRLEGVEFAFFANFFAYRCVDKNLFTCEVGFFHQRQVAEMSKQSKREEKIEI